MGLEGTIPPHMGNLSFLDSLDISFNHFYGDLPDELGHLRRLGVVDFSSNQFSGELPKTLFGNMTQDLEELILENNTFTGTIPQEIGYLSNLRVLDVYSKLSGRIPSTLSQCSQLQKLDLGNNTFSGTLPREIGNMTQLQQFYVDQNNITAMSWNIIVVLLIGLLAWAYQSFCPPSPHICESPGGPAIEAPKIKLRDGRHLAYNEHGVPKEIAKYKIILVHGFGSSRLDASLATSELVEKLGIHFVAFDRPGYGQSDPHPKQTVKSLALDIEELADQLELGDKVLHHWNFNGRTSCLGMSQIHLSQVTIN